MPDINVFCPHCGWLFVAPDEYVGKEAECSKCHNCFIIENKAKPIIVSQKNDTSNAGEENINNMAENDASNMEESNIGNSIESNVSDEIEGCENTNEKDATGKGSSDISALAEKLSGKNDLSPFSTAGRLSLGDYCLRTFVFVLVSFLVHGLFWLLAKLSVIFALIVTVPIMLFVLGLWISATIRRLHDHNLSGYWFFYFGSYGVPILYIVDILELDASVKQVTERFRKDTGSKLCWWIAAAICWLLVGPTVFLMALLVYPGKKECNMYGPYKD